MPQRFSMVGHRQRGATFVLILLAGMLLAACGPLGDDDDDPTATSESLTQPTTSSDTGSTEEADADDSAAIEADATEPDDLITADDGTPSGPEAISISTPVMDGTPGSFAPGAGDDGTPVATGPFATPVASDESYTGPGDGTSGATPPPDAASDDRSMLVAETPGAADATDASPVASPVGDAALLAELPAAMVTSCEPEIVPVITLADVAYVTNDDVNIRSGPGVDCDLLPISPIGVFMPVTLTGGPVSRDGEEFVWVQVTTSEGNSGWVITTALDPASS